MLFRGDGANQVVSQRVWLVFMLTITPSVCIELFDTFFAAGLDFNLSFNRGLIADGQWWRLLLGHFDHLGWSHLLLNILFLGVLLIVFPSMASLKALAILLCVYSLGISLLIWFFSLDLYGYVGLSGCLYGLLTFGLLRVRDYPLWLRGVFFLGLLIKVVYEYFWGAAGQVSEIIGGPVATDVHLYGFIMGLISVLVIRFCRV